jgi:uncharacterized protein (DUF885 family)
MNEDLNTLANEMVALRFRQEPLEAALLGIEEGSFGLAPLSRTEEDAAIVSYHGFAARACALQSDIGDALAERDVVLLDNLAYSADAIARQLGVRQMDFTITDFFNSPLSGVVTVLPQLPLDTAARRDQYIERLTLLPRYLAEAGERHREGVAAGRTPTRRGVDNTVTLIDRVLGDPDLVGLRRRAEDDDAFGAAVDDLLDGVVSDALRQYRHVLTSEILELGRDDEHPGLCWLPDGEALYDTMVQVSTSTTRSPRDLHATGLAIIEQLNQDYVTLGERLWGLTDVASVHDRLRNDPALRYESEEEMVAKATEMVRRAEAEAPKWFGLLPSTACAIEEVPLALAAGSAPAYYQTGAFDGSRVGTYFINTLKPEERFRHLAEAIAFHEAVPGHHFQLTIIQEVEGNHLAHSLFMDVANAEGWGLYAERLADEMGLYSDDVARLGMLSTDAWRAARLVVDTGLHGMGWSRQQAIDFMVANVPMPLVEVVAEVDRYIAMPGQALSYMVGRLEIESCRRYATDVLGDRFDVRAFHDVVLTTGPVLLPALRAAIERWVARELS